MGESDDPGIRCQVVHGEQIWVVDDRGAPDVSAIGHKHIIRYAARVACPCIRGCNIGASGPFPGSDIQNIDVAQDHISFSLTAKEHHL